MKRILLKLSGESLASDPRLAFNLSEEQHSSISVKSGIVNSNMLSKMISDIQKAWKQDVQIAIVIGGGNFCRGINVGTDQRVNTDKIGMLSTVINSLILERAFIQKGMDAAVLSVHEMPSICDFYTASKAKKLLEKGAIIICAGGSGQPFFSTDTAAVIRARELDCDVLFKATKVPGLYESDPKQNPQAQFIKQISYDDYIARGLKVMDVTAVSLAKDGKLPIQIGSVYEDDFLCQAIAETVKTSVIQ